MILQEKQLDYVKLGLNDAQIDLLNMMQWVKSPKALADLKQAISDFFAKKAKDEIDKMWASGKMTQEKFDSFETLHEDLCKL